MAWERLLTTGFEELYSGEFTIFGGGQHEVEPFNGNPNEAYTDIAAFENMGAATLLGIGEFGVWNQIRCGYYINPGDPFVSLNNVIGVGGLDLSLPDVPGYVVQYQADDWVFQFKHYGDAALEEISLSLYPGFNISEWCHVAFIAKAGVGGYFSFYLNGQLAIHYETSTLEDLRWIYLPGITSLSGMLSNTFVDSLYIDGSNDDEPNITPPSPQFHRIMPHAEGTVNQWALSNYSNRLDAISTTHRSFNDIPVLTADTNNQEEMFRFNSVVDYEESEVTAIILRARALCGSDCSLEFVARDDLTNQTISSGVSLQHTFKMLQHRFPLRPDGSSWTHDLSDIELGIKLDGVISAFPTPDPEWVNQYIVTAESNTIFEATTMYLPNGSSLPPSIFSGQQSVAHLLIPELVLLPLPTYTSLRIGHWWISTGITSQIFLISFEEGDGDHEWSIRMDDRQLTIYSTYTGSTREQTVMVGDTGFYRFREWRHLGYAIGDGYISLYLNGNLIFTETYPTGTGIFPSMIRIMGDSGANRLFIDDLYIDVSDEAKADAPPPIRRFEPFDLIYPGTEQEWLNKLGTGLTYPFSNGNTNQTKYIEATVAGLTNLYATSPYAHRPGFEPVGLGLYAYSEKGALDINGVLELSSVELELPFNHFVTPDEGWWYYNIYSELDPNGDPWDLDKISNAQIGVKSI